MSECYTPEQITIAERQSQQREEAGYYDAEKVVALTIKCDAMRAEVERLRDGWTFERKGEEIIVSKSGIGGCVVRQNAKEAREIPETILWLLASDMLAALAAGEKE